MKEMSNGQIQTEVLPWERSALSEAILIFRKLGIEFRFESIEEKLRTGFISYDEE